MLQKILNYKMTPNQIPYFAGCLLMIPALIVFYLGISSGAVPRDKLQSFEGRIAGIERLVRQDPKDKSTAVIYVISAANKTSGKMKKITLNEWQIRDHDIENKEGRSIFITYAEDSDNILSPYSLDINNISVISYEETAQEKTEIQNILFRLAVFIAVVALVTSAFTFIIANRRRNSKMN